MNPDPDDCEISIHPAPGTCCPEQHVIDGQCKSCGHVYDEVLALVTKQAHWQAMVDPKSETQYNGICLHCGGAGKHAVRIYEGGKITDKIAYWTACPGCVRCCETCDEITMHDDQLTGHCLHEDFETNFDYVCPHFKRQRDY